MPPHLRAAPLPRFAISYHRLPEGRAYTVVVEGPTLEAAARTIRRFLGDDAPGKPSRYLLSSNGVEIPSSFAGEAKPAPVTASAPGPIRVRPSN